MEFALGGAAFLSFYAGFPASALLLRCGLSASQRFSPRASLALSSIAALCAAAGALLARGGLRAVPSSFRRILMAGAFMGGTIGRALLLMTAARLPSSYDLLRVQALPLLALCVLSLAKGLRFPIRRRLPLLGWAFFCAMTDGFFGAGGICLLSLAALDGVVRRRNSPSALALLLQACAQAGAIALTLAVGAAEVFPWRMLLSISSGALLGALAAEANKKRGATVTGLRIALKAYGIIAALSGLEQAFVH